MDGLGFEEPAHFPQRPREVVVAPAQHGDGARRRRVEAHDHAHRGRLARSVGPEEAGHGPRANVEGQIVDRDDVAEALGEPAGLDHPLSLAQSTLLLDIALSCGRTQALLAQIGPVSPVGMLCWMRGAKPGQLVQRRQKATFLVARLGYVANVGGSSSSHSR